MLQHMTSPFSLHDQLPHPLLLNTHTMLDHPVNRRWICTRCSVHVSCWMGPCWGKLETSLLQLLAVQRLKATCWCCKKNAGPEWPRIE